MGGTGQLGEGSQACPQQPHATAARRVHLCDSERAVLYLTAMFHDKQFSCLGEWSYLRHMRAFWMCGCFSRTSMFGWGILFLGPRQTDSLQELRSTGSFTFCQRGDWLETNPRGRVPQTILEKEKAYMKMLQKYQLHATLDDVLILKTLQQRAEVDRDLNPLWNAAGRGIRSSRAAGSPPRGCRRVRSNPDGRGPV